MTTLVALAVLTGAWVLIGAVLALFVARFVRQAAPPITPEVIVADLAAIAAGKGYRYSLTPHLQQLIAREFVAAGYSK